MLKYLSIEHYSCFCCLAPGEHAGLVQDLQEAKLLSEKAMRGIRLKHAQLSIMTWCSGVSRYVQSSFKQPELLRLDLA